MSTKDTIKTRGRLAGFLYLLVAVTGYFPYAIRHRLIVPDDSARTATNILAASELFRLSVVSELAMTGFWILTAHALAVLFKAVGRHACRLMVGFVLVSSATVCANALGQIAALQLLQGADYLAAMASAFPAPLGRIPGLLLIVAGLGYLADFLVGFLLPTTKVTFARFTFVGELLLLLWLLVRGATGPAASCDVS